MATVTRRLAALLGASGAGLTDSATSSQITTTSLKDDAVTSAKIGTDQVGADALSSSAIAGAADIPANSVGESELSVDYTAQSVPHIIPGVLQPAVAGNDLSGTALGGSYVYGTAHTDGHSYYYTDIKGSKPIKDPRIGGHFGSQRHVFTSLQLLEQETATHGENVYTVDGRGWCRLLDASGTSKLDYGSQGHRIQTGSTSDFLEVVGYFSHVNVIDYKTSEVRRYAITVDGGTEGGNSTSPSVTNPLWGRYVNAGSVENYDINESLGIHTLKIRATGTATYPAYFFGIELIAQDTTSTANRSKIQIPSQDVVSYGKKFNVSAEGSSGHHYNPFNGYTATTSFSSVVDVDTSLGLEAWKHTDNNYYPPVNGGRVLKWVDSSGTIKTSVTLMPPNATGIGSFSSNPRDPNYGSWSSQYQPTFKNETERQLHEVAKTFDWREFGNGSANGGTGATYADASMLSGTADDIAYVMDDGLTSLSADDFKKNTSHESMMGDGSGDAAYITYIGTGVSVIGDEYETSMIHVAKNLPYGTHILKVVRESDDTTTYHLDGISIYNSSGTKRAEIKEATIYQPKRPPIPEDACVLADYMLMADFVPQTNGDLPHISKGVRYCSASRDSYIDGNSATSTKFFQNVSYGTGGFQVSLNQDGYTLSEGRIVGFGHAFGTNFMRDSDRITNVQARLDGSNYTYSSSDIWDTDTVWDDTNDDGTLTKNGSSSQEVYGIKNQTLGIHTFGDKTTSNPGNSNKFNDWIGWQIATPIHTSSHYQSFETPFLHELVGGDRNMEQHNLVVSPDGKTWDQLTRDVSYIGNGVLFLNGIDGDTSTSGRQHETAGAQLVFLDCRGSINGGESNLYNKDFAIAYNRYICLKDGQYRVAIFTIASADGQGGDHGVIRLNSQLVARGHTGTSGYGNAYCSWEGQINRGDYISIHGRWHSSDNYSGFSITRI